MFRAYACAVSLQTAMQLEGEFTHQGLHILTKCAIVEYRIHKPLEVNYVRFFQVVPAARAAT